MKSNVIFLYYYYILLLLRFKSHKSVAYQGKIEFNPDPNKQATELFFPVRKIVQPILSFLQWYCSAKTFRTHT